jgi:hypothetical protein
MNCGGEEFVRLRSSILLLAVAALVWVGCDEDPIDPGCDPCPPLDPFLEPTSPENVVANLQAAYRLRDIEEYAKLLAPEFTFVLQPVDAQNIGTDFWTRDQDSTGTVALFTTELVSNIMIELLHGSAEAPIDSALTPGTKWIRIHQTLLEVDEASGTSWLVTDLQDMFFRQGKAAAGEDTTQWFLLEWRDIPTFTSPTPSSGTQEATWGKLKAQY